MFITQNQFKILKAPLASLGALAVLFSAFFLTLSFLGAAFAAPRKESVQVAFFEVRDARGNPVHLEPKFPWAHMAISIDGAWLHAHPATGVEWVSGANLENYGRIAHTMNVPKWFKLRLDLVDEFLGRPYDGAFSWDDRALYCSELVAKLLGIAPVPMVFDPQFWPRDYLRFNGLPGISPGLVYRRLIQEGLR